MKKFVFLFIVAGLVLTNCAEQGKYTFSLNPDGTGKLKFKTEANLFSMDDSKSAKELAKKAAVDVIQKSKGVTAWSKFKYKTKKDKRWEVEGELYFDDVRQLKLHNLTHFNWMIQKDGKGLVVSNDKTAREKMNKTKHKSSEAQTKQKEQWVKSMRKIMQIMMENTDIKVYINVPGTVDKVSLLKKTKKNQVMFHFNGKKFFKIYDEAMTAGGMSDEQMMAKYYGAGAKEGIKATVKGKIKPLFKYKTQLKKAKKAHAKIVKKFK